MSIAFVSVTNAASTDSVSTNSVSVTVPAGSNRALVACLQNRSSIGDSPATTVVFNGSESLIFIQRSLNNIGGGNPLWGTEIWYLLNPSVTTANVVATYADNRNDGAMGLSVVLLTGVTALDASNGATGNATTATMSLTTAADSTWIVDSAIGRDDAGFTMTAHTNRTQRTNRTIGFNIEGVGISTQGPNTAGSYTLDWQQLGGGGSYDWSISAASFAPASNTPPFTARSYTPDVIPLKPYPSRLALESQSMVGSTWVNFYPAATPPPAGDVMMPAGVW